jgi:3',5'-cyclic AMP phosphodiesterase CpdA
MPSYLLAHLSDPHLGPLPRPRLGELAGKRAIGLVNWWRKRGRIHRGDVLARIVAELKAQAPDHVAVTGDLANLSLPGEYPRGRAWLQSLGAPRDVTLVPGNHDAYVRGTDGALLAQWGEYMRGDTGETAGANAAAFPFLRRRGPLALIGLSSGLPTGPLMATGRLGAAQIARLGETLDESARENLFRIVLIHHPPLSKPARRFRRLVDAPALRAVLARHGAELLLHGHDHEHAFAWLDGPRGKIPAVCVPSASERPPGEHDSAGYNLYRISGAPGAWRCEVISRGLAPDGMSIVERSRGMVIGG